ncbi:hypothetical protein CDS [Bradyrhizobium sp.]|nr:hypothetical protein CDS [Bradyrhizobium sp.]
MRAANFYHLRDRWWIVAFDQPFKFLRWNVGNLLRAPKHGARDTELLCDLPN